MFFLFRVGKVQWSCFSPKVGNSTPLTAWHVLAVFVVRMYRRRSITRRDNAEVAEFVIINVGELTVVSEKRILGKGIGALPKSVVDGCLQLDSVHFHICKFRVPSQPVNRTSDRHCQGWDVFRKNQNFSATLKSFDF